MHTVHSLVRAAGALLLLAATAAADVIHVPAEQPSVAAAVAVAVDGDLILVEPGSYPVPILLDGLGVSIVGHGGVVKLRSITVRNLPAGEAVLLQNLNVDLGFGFNDDDDAITLLDCAGAVRIEACTAVGDYGDPGAWQQVIYPTDGGSGLRMVHCDDVVVVHGFLAGGDGGSVKDEDLQWMATAGGPAANVRSSQVAFFGVDLHGGNGGSIMDTIVYTAGAGGAGLLNVSGVVHVSGCSLTGGHGGYGDCDYFSCGSGGSGGDGILQTQSVATISLRQNSLTPGGGGSGGDGSPAPDGKLVDLAAGSLQHYGPAYRDLTATSSVAEGEHEVLTVNGQPGDVAILLVSLTPDWLEKPALQGLYTVAPPLSVQVLGVVGPSPLTLDALVPELGPGLTHLVGRVQLVIKDAAGIHLGPSSTLVLRDAAE